MRSARQKTSVKLLASAALVAAAAGVAGLGTFGSFTSTTSASATVGSGTVLMQLGTDAANNSLDLPASGLVPGDTVQRAVSLSNAGDQAFSSVTLTTTASKSSLLDTDAANGLRFTLESCSIPWTKTTATAPSYTCSGTVKTVLEPRPVIGSNLALANLQALTPGRTDYLRVKLWLPESAGNTFQGLSSTIALAMTATQRTATDQ